MIWLPSQKGKSSEGQEENIMMDYLWNRSFDLLPKPNGLICNSGFKLKLAADFKKADNQEPLFFGVRCIVGEFMPEGLAVMVEKGKIVAIFDTRTEEQKK